MKLIKTLFILPFLFSLTACESDEDNQLAVAQQCLDGAETASAAQACYNSIAGLNTEEAWKIKCALRFIIGGVTEQDFIDGFVAFETANANADPILVLASSIAIDATNKSALISECSYSGNAGLKKIAGISSLGRFLIDTAGSSDPATIADNLTSGDDQNLGSEVRTILSTTCTSGEVSNDDPVCGSLECLDNYPNDPTGNTNLGAALRACFDASNCEQVCGEP